MSFDRVYWTYQVRRMKVDQYMFRMDASRLEVPEFRLFYLCRTIHADYPPEFCSTNSEIIPRFLNDRMSASVSR